MAASENEGQAQMFLRELTQQVQTLKGVGPAISAKLNKAGIVTAADILLRYPRQDRYEDRITRRPLVSVVPFPAMPDISHNISASRELTTVVKIIDISNMYIQKKRIPCIIVSDGTAQARLLAFRHPDIERTLAMGESYLLWGNFSYSEKYRKIQSSDFEIERENAPPEALAKKHFNEILPVYRLEQGLRQWHYRTLTAAALAQYGDKIDDELPPELLEKYRLMSKKNAVRAIHFPRGFDELRQAQKTLIFEELFYLEMLIAQRAYSRKKRAAVSPNAAVSPDTAVSPNAAAPSAAAGDCTPLQRRLVERLPFKLTDGQRQALREINAGLDNPPEARLLQGDVGSGKTLVSFLAALKTVEGGGQAVIMAPTELLAYQHAENAAALLEPLGIRAAFLTGHVKAAGRKHLLSALAAGEIDIVAGTHALFSRDVVYKNLRLAVIDEQHRFGVTQRQAILDKGGAAEPSLLMMSATPIPRTLAQTIFGDMDVSVIRGLPPNRKPVLTRTFSQTHEEKVYELVRRELQAGRQAYFVYPLIGETDEAGDSQSGEKSGGGEQGGVKDALKDAKSMAEKLATEIFPEYKTALIHSKIDDDEKKRAMESFRRNEIQILAATSVVEVGVDVPNATCMVIEHAERFGLSALHQLRGRVGRGAAESTCFLVWTEPEAPLARESSGEKLEIWQKRLKVMRETTDGFVIAEEDLQLRGPGQLTGTEQSGYFSLGLANVLRDAAVLEKARADAFAILEADPALAKPENAVIAQSLSRAPRF